MSTTTIQNPAWLSPTSHQRWSADQLWQIPSFLVGLVALVLVGWNDVSRQGQQLLRLERGFQTIRAAFDNPEADWVKVTGLAKQTLEQAQEYPSRIGEAHLLLAASLTEWAESSNPEESEHGLQLGTNHQKTASSNSHKNLTAGQQSDPGKWRTLSNQIRAHLEQAEANGVPNRDKPWLAYLLGKSFYTSGEDLQQTIDYLTWGLPKGTDNPARGYGMLVQCYLKRTPPDRVAALKANAEQIRQTQDDRQLWPARVLRAKLLIHEKQDDEAMKVLGQVIQASAAKPLRLQARYLLAKLCVKKGLWAKAAPLWEELAKTPQIVEGGRRRIYYILGQCYYNSPSAETRETGTKALVAWEQARALGGEEGLAASFLLAELRLYQPTRDFAKAVAEIQGALVDINNPSEYKNSLMPLKKAQGLIELAIRVMRDNEAYEMAAHLAQVYKKISPAGKAEVDFAEISVAWADKLEQASTAKPVSKTEAEEIKIQAKLLREQAAAAFKEAASLDSNKSQHQLLWGTIQSYQKANMSRQAIFSLKQYLKLPLSEVRLAEGWYTLAEAHRSLDEPNEAMKAYLECLKLDQAAREKRQALEDKGERSPTLDTVIDTLGLYASQSRLQLGILEKNRENFEVAQDYFLRNLQASADIHNEATEASHYQLAFLLYEQTKRYDLSVEYLRKAVLYYPGNEKALLAHYRLGDCYRKLAAKLPTPLLEEHQVPIERKDVEEKRREWFRRAEKEFVTLRNGLRNKERDSFEEGLYRKASFAIADVRAESGDVPLALWYYEELAKEFSGQVEELAACYFYYKRGWLLPTKDKPHAARILRKLLAQADVTFAKIPDAQLQDHNGESTRESWQRWLKKARNKAAGSADQLWPNPTQMRQHSVASPRR
ncbi:MAG: tetratricopeptide repeat protein [Gemmataceae bacterium]